MNFPSTILSIFGKHSGTQNPLDAQITINPELNAVLEIPTITNILGNGAGFPLQGQSFALDFTQQVTNAAGLLDVSVVTIAPGLWDLDFFAQCYSNDTTAGTSRVLLYFRDVDTLLSVVILCFRPFFPTLADQTSRKLRIAVNAKTALDIRVFISNTAATKTTDFDGSIFANRLG